MSLPNPFTEITDRLDRIEKNILLIQDHFQNNSKGIDSSKEFLTLSQAAEYLNLANPTVYAMVGKRKIKYYKRTKRLYFLKSDLEEFIGAGRNKSISEIEDETKI
jgi:excisionase family DNA binding protein